MRKKLAAGNWKMNGTGASLPELETLSRTDPTPGCEVLICPPAPLIHRAAQTLRGSGILIGGQDCHPDASGAHTGDTSALMLADAGASHVIVGHSERRNDHGESNALVRAKATAAIEAGLIAIICLGESLEDREADRTLAVIADQFSGSVPDTVSGATLVLAYEPVWAIGTGKVPSVDQIGEVHTYLRASLDRRFGADISGGTRLLYGGSVKPENARDIFAVPDVDGALVGGASLKAANFLPIIEALDAA